MADSGITRRDLLRGVLRRKQSAAPEPASPPRDIGELPSVISWLDPQLRHDANTQDAERHASPMVLRPPGALAEADFLAACTKCGDCVTACEPNAITIAPERMRDAAGTPIIDPLVAPCLMCEDFPCIAACEPGALREDAAEAIGVAHISRLDCLGGMGTGCTTCIERCPVPGALTLREGVPDVQESLCTGCGICQHVCPAPNNAVLLLPTRERPDLATLSARAERVAQERADTEAHSFADPEEEELVLPELQDEIVNDETIRRLFADLEALTDVLEIRVKGAAREHSGAAPSDLASACDLLLHDHVRAVQIIYHYQGEDWSDTLMRTPKGNRLLRMQASRRADGSDAGPESV